MSRQPKYKLAGYQRLRLADAQLLHWQGLSEYQIFIQRSNGTRYQLHNIVLVRIHNYGCV